ncbi:DUF6090 family protein [Winogradskyella flava]|uniref:Uncharacterized protein n=1 Tax=Winogradskyella flava TaxID=1884876 RepID=A0A842IQC3_9FLAO|nr:DUF6090 family protein [Winogradskyella flava]MBC2844056.1 hypothetical protein [Winogradskyella flava]
MIKFFRKIRQNLLMENKTSKYFKYAIGEIILVVIGILIALQINNWNEQRKNSKQEVRLLKQLQTDISTNKNNVEEQYKRLIINKGGIDSLIFRLENKHYDLMVPMYLSQALRKSDFNRATSGYNIMQNGKASLISDESVLKSILNLYENDLPDILDRQIEMNNSIDYIQNDFINKLFKKAPNSLSIKFNEFDVVSTDLFEPIDFSSLSQNIEFRNILIQFGKLVEARLVYLKNTEAQLDETIQILDSKTKLDQHD